jgi:sugar lactone lactonase YvrE
MAQSSRPPPWRRRSSILLRVLAVIVGVMLLLLLFVRLRYGGGEPFPTRNTGKPKLDASALEVVAELPLPPGNIAVSDKGRIFFTFHPEGHPTVKLAELVNREPKPWPSVEIQSERDGLWLDTPLGLRLDRQGRLWVLDNANHGTGDAKLVAFDVKSGNVVREHHFTSSEAGLGSHLNDLAVHPNGDRVYIAEASIFGKTPALLLYDLRTGKMRRLLNRHSSVSAEDYYITVDGEPIEVAGLFAIRPGIDSIALDRTGEWLYFAAVTATKMYRIKTADLDDTSLTPEALATRVEVFGEKTLSDGISSDEAGTLYLTDPEHNAIVTMRPALETLISDARLRWPDGLSFGPDGYLYLTCSALQHVIMKDADHIQSFAPYHIFRFVPGGRAVAGH